MKTIGFDQPRKIEGLERSEDCDNIFASAHTDSRDTVGCIILGRGEDDLKVHEWLATAAGVKGFIGFAVGQTDFCAPVALRYENFVGIFEKGRPF